MTTCQSTEAQRNRSRKENDRKEGKRRARHEMVRLMGSRIQSMGNEYIVSSLMLAHYESLTTRPINPPHGKGSAVGQSGHKVVRQAILTPFAVSVR